MTKQLFKLLIYIVDDKSGISSAIFGAVVGTIIGIMLFWGWSYFWFGVAAIAILLWAMS